jgi:hypothetical protein
MDIIIGGMGTSLTGLNIVSDVWSADGVSRRDATMDCNKDSESSIPDNAKCIRVRADRVKCELISVLHPRQLMGIRMSNVYLTIAQRQEIHCFIYSVNLRSIDSS